MKIKAKLKPILLAFGLALGVMAIPVGIVHAQTTVGTETGEGAVEMGNTGDATDLQPGAEPGAEPTAQADAANAPAETAEAKPPKDPREAHRDLVMKAPEDAQGATSAASRRYKMVNKEGYNALMQGGAEQPAQ
jgi:hypothetical protein